MQPLHLMDTSTDNPEYSMRVVIEPRQAIRPGHLLQPPLVVSLHVVERRSSEDQPLVDEIPEDETPSSPQSSLSSRNTAEQDCVKPDIESLWAFVHLVPETAPESESIYTCDQPKLCGGLANTLEEPLNRDVGGTIGYFKFENLTISDPGAFRFRITLCRTILHNNESISALAGATTIACVDTRRIVVHPLAPQYPPGKSLCSSQSEQLFLTLLRHEANNG